MPDQPAYPLFFRVLAILNLLAGMTLIFFTCWFITGGLTRFYFITPAVAHIGLWLIISTFAWFLTSGKSVIFLYTTAASVLLFMSAIIYHFFFYKGGSEFEKIIVTTLAAFSVLYAVFNLIAARSRKAQSWKRLNSTLTGKSALLIVLLYLCTFSSGYSVYYLIPQPTEYYSTSLEDFIAEEASQDDPDDLNYSDIDNEAIIESGLAERTFNEDELLAIYENVVTEYEKKPEDWAFLEEGDSVVLNGITFREFIGGPIGLRWLILPAIAEFKKIKFSDTWEMIGSLHSEVRIFSSLTGGGPVTVNDEKVAAIEESWPGIPYENSFLHWAYSNFVPYPGDFIYDVEAQEIYDVVFRRFFRLMIESYYELNVLMDPEEEKDWYLTITDNAVEDLWNRYSSVLPAYIIERGGQYFAPELAIGFWLRRKIDGNEGVIFDGLSLIMHRFDSDWFSGFESEV